ncbi:hypothetical protein [Paraburkholderia sp.]|uniref:hypothetical protein n=1 Tax=Paraburkholderia sp. TaxID=1926495 RepID=UPI0025D6ED40|nr:hypothetical protein [Paraburkholderia sp.]
MKKQSMLHLSVVILASVGAFSMASQQAYAQVDHQQAQTQPAALAQVADVQQAGAVDGHGATAGSADAVAHQHNGRWNRGPATPECVGPVSFCNVFFGS